MKIPHILFLALLPSLSFSSEYSERKAFTVSHPSAKYFYERGKRAGSTAIVTIYSSDPTSNEAGKFIYKVYGCDNGYGWIGYTPRNRPNQPLIGSNWKLSGRGSDDAIAESICDNAMKNSKKTGRNFQ